MTREEFLLDTLEYYSQDPSRRCFHTETRICYYSPVNADNPNSEGCAIGRWLSPDLQLKLDDETYPGVDIDDVFEQLPDNLQQLGQSFLASVQFLHDSNSWREGGVINYNIERLKKIIQEYELNYEKFKKYMLND